MAWVWNRNMFVYKFSKLWQKSSGATVYWSTVNDFLWFELPILLDYVCINLKILLPKPETNPHLLSLIAKHFKQHTLFCLLWLNGSVLKFHSHTPAIKYIITFKHAVYRFLISNTWAHIICWANALLTCSEITAWAEQPNKCTSWLILSTKTGYGLVLTPGMVMLVKVAKQRRVKRSSLKEQLRDTFFFFFTSVEDKMEGLWSWSTKKIIGFTVNLPLIQME